MPEDIQIFFRSHEVPVVRQLVEVALKEGFEWMGWKQNADLADIKAIRFFKEQSDAENFCWDPEHSHLFGGAKVFAVYDALIDINETEQGRKTAPYLTAISLHSKDMVDPDKSKLNEPFEDLTGQLKRLQADFGILRRNTILELKAGRLSFHLTASVSLSHERYILRVDASKKTDGRYLLDGFSVSGIPIEKEWQGIDLMRLQTQMSDISWAKELLNPSEQEKINIVIRTLGEMSNAPDGRLIVDKLFDKYIKLGFARRAFFEDDIKSPFYKKQEFPINPSFPITISDAVNLFEGRSLYRPIPDNSSEMAWFALHPVQKDHNGNSMLAQFRKEFNYDLNKAFAELAPFAHITPEDREELINKMQNGNALILLFRFKGANRSGLIYADIPDGSITIKNQSGGIFTRVSFPNPVKGQALYNPYVALWDNKLQNHNPNEEKSIRQNPIENEDYPENNQSRKRKR